MRLDAVQELYESGHLSLAEGIETFLKWRDYHEGLIIMAENITQKTRAFIGIQARKRGNKVHEWYVSQQLKPILAYSDTLNYERFIDDDPFVMPGGRGSILNDRTSLAYTNCVMITLEYNSNAGRAIDCWKNIGKDLNRFYASLRRHFGKVSYIRAYEAHESGYPHIHMILFFKESWLKVFKYHNKFRCKITPLIKLLWSRPNYVMVEGKRKIAKTGAVRLGFVDVLAVNNLGGGIRYICKYVLKMNKALENSVKSERDKLILTLALNWLHGRRAFAISGDFIRVMSDYRRDRLKHNSNLSEPVQGLDNESYYRRWYTNDLGKRTFDLMKYYYCGSYAWSSIILCSGYSRFTPENSPYIIPELDITQLPAVESDRLANWVAEIDEFKRDREQYFIKSVYGMGELVCIHCREYRNDNVEAMRKHVDAGKCNVYNARKARLEYRFEDYQKGLLRFGFGW